MCIYDSAVNHDNHYSPMRGFMKAKQKGRINDKVGEEGNDKGIEKVLHAGA